MANSIATIPGATATALVLPDNLSLKHWREIGERLALIDRATGWWIGDWWNQYKPAWGDQAKQCRPENGWHGPAYSTCRQYGATAAAFPPDKRMADLPFIHHHMVARLPAPDAEALLLTASRELRDSGTLLPSRMLGQEAKKRRRAARVVELADGIERVSRQIGHRLYGVILADPPWQFEPYSRKSGMDRAAENHYPTMPTDAICAMQVPAADDCALFLWATAPMLPDALDVMDEWGFTYQTHFVWRKPTGGTGYWNRSWHELLLLGTRGQVPAPAPGEQYASVFEGAVGEHSVKPAAAAEMIEAMFPQVPLLEMFARAPRLGWDVWGAEIEATHLAGDSADVAA